MANDPDPRWERFAAREPYFAVLTSPQFLRQNLTAEAQRAFFESGDALVASMFRAIELQLSPYFNPSAILEYGCGAGRLAIPLARRSARNAGTVTAVDRSPAMLGAARQEAERHGVSNVEFQTPAELFADGRTFDFITCYFVLQRLPAEEGLPLIAALLERLTPKGVAVFHVPFRSTASGWVKAIRWVRHSVPAANALVNMARRRPSGEPFVPTHTYDLARVFEVIRAAGIETMHVVFEPHEGLETALLYMEKPAERRAAETSADDGAPIDVAELVEHTSIEELNQAAEEYFASITQWDHQLTKPFSQAHESPTLLIDMAVLMQGLQLTAGATVLDFGAGTGWFARFLTQLGCRVILLDVSETALEMARELYRRQPVIGDRPEPEFLLFDGRRIPLPDASVDRVLSFHAFHHAPQPGGRSSRSLRACSSRAASPASPSRGRAIRERPSRSSRCGTTVWWRTTSTSTRSGGRRKEWAFGDLQAGRLPRAAVPRAARRVRGLSRGRPGHGAMGHLDARVPEKCAHVLPDQGRRRARGQPPRRGPRLPHSCARNRDDRAGRRGHRDRCARDEYRDVDLAAVDRGSRGRRLRRPPVRRIRSAAASSTRLCRRSAIRLVRSPLARPSRCGSPSPAQREGRYVVELDCVAAHVSWFAPLGSRPVRVTVTVTS